MFLALVVEHLLEVEDTGHNVSSGLALHKVIKTCILELRTVTQSMWMGPPPAHPDSLHDPHHSSRFVSVSHRSAQCWVSLALDWTAVTGAGSCGGDSLSTDLDHGGNTGLKLQILYVEHGIPIITIFRLIFKDSNVFQIRNIILH